MLERTVNVARACARDVDGIGIVVATDDKRVIAHARSIGVDAVMTGSSIESGTGRALAAVRQLAVPPAIVVNLQGDAPFTPPMALSALIRALEHGCDDAATPVVRLDWAALDAMRLAKRTTPFSGTTAAVAADGRALWFSKSVLPAMRDEAAMREKGLPCPVLRHVGVYTFRLAALERFQALGPGVYERLEGLEQLRMLEAGMTIRAIEIDTPRLSMSGIDSPEDVERAEALIALMGDPWHDALPSGSRG